MFSLPQNDFGGQKVSRKGEEWTLSCTGHIHTAHRALSALYQNLSTDDYAALQEPRNLTKPELKGKSIEQLAGLFIHKCQAVIELFNTPYKASVKFPLGIILKLITRCLSLSFQEVTRLPSLKELANILPQLQQSVMDILLYLIWCCGSNLLPHSRHILNLLQQVLKSTELMEPTQASMTRCSVHSVLSEWLKMAGMGSQFQAQTFFIQEVIQDIHVTRSPVQANGVPESSTSSDVPCPRAVGKGKTAKLKRKMLKNSYADLPSGHDVDEVIGAAPELTQVTQCALDLATTILERGQYLQVQSLMQSVLEMASSLQRSDLSARSPYNDGLCKLSLYRALRMCTSVALDAGLGAPDIVAHTQLTQQAQSLMSHAAHTDEMVEVKSYCKQWLCQVQSYQSLQKPLVRKILPDERDNQLQDLTEIAQKAEKLRDENEKLRKRVLDVEMERQGETRRNTCLKQENDQLRAGLSDEKSRLLETQYSYERAVEKYERVLEEKYNYERALDRQKKVMERQKIALEKQALEHQALKESYERASEKQQNNERATNEEQNNDWGSEKQQHDDRPSEKQEDYERSPEKSKKRNRDYDSSDEEEEDSYEEKRKKSKKDNSYDDEEDSYDEDEENYDEEDDQSDDEVIELDEDGNENIESPTYEVDEDEDEDGELDEEGNDYAELEPARPPKQQELYHDHLSQGDNYNQRFAYHQSGMPGQEVTSNSSSVDNNAYAGVVNNAYASVVNNAYAAALQENVDSYQAQAQISSVSESQEMQMGYAAAAEGEDVQEMLQDFVDADPDGGGSAAAIEMNDVPKILDISSGVQCENYQSALMEGVVTDQDAVCEESESASIPSNTDNMDADDGTAALEKSIDAPSELCDQTTAEPKVSYEDAISSSKSDTEHKVSDEKEQQDQSTVDEEVPAQQIVASDTAIDINEVETNNGIQQENHENQQSESKEPVVDESDVGSVAKEVDNGSGDQEEQLSRQQTEISDEMVVDDEDGAATKESSTEIETTPDNDTQQENLTSKQADSVCPVSAEPDVDGAEATAESSEIIEGDVSGESQKENSFPHNTESLKQVSADPTDVTSAGDATKKSIHMNGVSEMSESGTMSQQSSTLGSQNGQADSAPGVESNPADLDVEPDPDQ